MSIFRLSPIECTDNGTRTFYDYTAPTRYSHSSHLALMDIHAIFNFFKGCRRLLFCCLLYSVPCGGCRLLSSCLRVCTHTRCPCSCRASLGT